MELWYVSMLPAQLHSWAVLTSRSQSGAYGYPAVAMPAVAAGNKLRETARVAQIKLPRRIDKLIKRRASSRKRGGKRGGKGFEGDYAVTRGSTVM
jgi:hypothetical protein